MPRAGCGQTPQEQTMAEPGAARCDMLFDEGGNPNRLIQRARGLEAKDAKDGALPDPARTDDDGGQAQIAEICSSMWGRCNSADPKEGKELEARWTQEWVFARPRKHLQG